MLAQRVTFKLTGTRQRIVSLVWIVLCSTHGGHGLAQSSIAQGPLVHLSRVATRTHSSHYIPTTCTHGCCITVVDMIYVPDLLGVT